MIAPHARGCYETRAVRWRGLGLFRSKMGTTLAHSPARQEPAELNHRLEANPAHLATVQRVIADVLEVRPPEKSQPLSRPKMPKR